MTPRIRPILPGATYFITSVTHHRTRWFSDPRSAGILVDQLNHYTIEYGFTLHCYAVMPDHYHAVITPGAGHTISQVLHSLHSYSATLLNTYLENQQKTKIWQGNAWDTVARDDAMAWRMIAYTLLNPWREGLVSSPLNEYPFSDISRWRAAEGDDFLLDLFALVRDGREFGEA